MLPYYDDTIAAVPEYDRYLGLTELEAATDRLAAAHPELEVRTAGASRAGRPIRCLEIPGGPLHAVLVGLPHADEPAGGVALEYLLPLLAGGLAAERLRAAIAGRAFAGHGGRRHAHVTATFCLAQLDADERSPEALIARADAALYAGKRTGRDRVVTDGR